MGEIFGETERLIIRRLTTSKENCAFIVKLLNEPKFLQYIGDKAVRDEEAAKLYLENGPIHSYLSHGFGLYLILLKDGKTEIGMSGLLKREELPHVDIGYAFLNEFEQKGYAMEATEYILKKEIEKHNISRILAIVCRNNLSSIRLLSKLSFHYLSSKSAFLSANQRGNEEDPHTSLPLDGEEDLSSLPPDAVVVFYLDSFSS